ncbi:hypothetical protein [Candidatus Sodalis sp. SoCistrobi]|uniref:hypothetical protein n=1 Tax=Candidatus Sodalis sp. SoCistrobi TaxID=1922216 RepID=UPI000939A477|nr:hypothetical protein [Candidatus Sodalis sp. SoCistrobi]
MTYDKKSIRILREEEIDRFDWSRTARLADEHHLPLEWVKRGFEAARRIGADPEYFVQKYILKAETAAIPEFEAVFLEIVREERDRNQR